MGVVAIGVVGAGVATGAIVGTGDGAGVGALVGGGALVGIGISPHPLRSYAAILEG